MYNNIDILTWRYDTAEYRYRKGISVLRLYQPTQPYWRAMLRPSDHQARQWTSSPVISLLLVLCREFVHHLTPGFGWV